MQIFDVIIFFELRTIQQKTVKPTYLCPLGARKLAERKAFPSVVLYVARKRWLQRKFARFVLFRLIKKRSFNLFVCLWSILYFPFLLSFPTQALINIHGANPQIFVGLHEQYKGNRQSYSAWGDIFIFSPYHFIVTTSGQYVPCNTAKINTTVSRISPEVAAYLKFLKFISELNIFNNK